MLYYTLSKGFKHYKLPTIPLQQLISISPTANELKFINRLYAEINRGITCHLSYAETFMEDNKIPCEMTEIHRDRLALEYFFYYYYNLKHMSYLIGDHEKLIELVLEHQKSCFAHLNQELNDKGFDKVKGYEGLEGFLHRRSRFHSPWYYGFASYPITLQTEMRFRVMLITDPLYNEGFKKLVADHNRGRVISNANHLTLEFIHLEHYLKFIIEEYLCE